MTPEQFKRFEAKVHVEPNTGCLLWTAYLCKDGYGLMQVGSRTDNTRRAALAHRLSYEHHVGPIPEGLVLDHLCCFPGKDRPMHSLKLDLATMCLIAWLFLLGCRQAEIGPTATVSWLWLLGPVLIPVVAVLAVLGWSALITLRDKYGR